jgi:hypothetical protein
VTKTRFEPCCSYRLAIGAGPVGKLGSEGVAFALALGTTAGAAHIGLIGRAGSDGVGAAFEAALHLALDGVGAAFGDESVNGSTG